MNDYLMDAFEYADWAGHHTALTRCVDCGELTPNTTSNTCHACQLRPRCKCCDEFCDRLEDGKDARYCIDCRIETAERCRE